MGLDGGTYITRADVLRGQSWAMANTDTSRSTRGGNVSASTVYQAKSLDIKTERQSRWSACLLTGKPLAGHIVADWLGSLYLYEAVLEFLLARAGLSVDDDSQDRLANQLRQNGDLSQHLKTKRDVFRVYLPAGSPANSAAVTCPVTDLRSDTVPFSALVPCGHIFSDRAISKMSDSSCALCAAAFTQQDVVPICPSAEKLQALRDSLSSRVRGSKHKHSSKRKRLPPEEDARATLHTGPAEPA